MSLSESQQSCHNWLNQLAQHDSFISRHDQTLQIEEYLSELAENLQRLDKDIGSRFLRLMEETRSEFTKHANTIEEAKSHLQTIFDQMAKSPRNPPTLKRVSHALGQQVNLLSRRMRPRMLRALEKLSPKYRIIEKPANELSNFRLQASKPLPEYLWLLSTSRKGKTVEPGSSLFELEFTPQADKLCRLPFISPLRFALFRWKCKRHYAFYHLPFKAIVLDCLITRSELNPAHLIQRHQATHDELLNMLTDAWRSIRYNLETAATELEDISLSLISGHTEDIGDRPEELQTITFDALNKCLETFDDITVTYASFLDAVIAEISHDHQNAVSAAASGIRDSSNIRTRLRWALRSSKKNWKKRIDQTLGSSRQSFQKLKQLPANIIDHTIWMFTLINYFKRQQPVEESLLQLTDLPTEAELLEQSKVLPPIYRRLFQNEPLTNREFLVGMEAEMNLLTETYMRWRSGRASSVAIVGPEGSGKTSMLNCFQNELEEDVKVSRTELLYRMRTSADVLSLLENVLAIEEPSYNAIELISKIQRLDRQIVILEHGHQLLLRTVGSREAFETFFYIVMNTRTNLFWLLSFRLHPWKRMGYMHQIERFFTHVIKSEFHNAHELKTALLFRQRATGQEPLFSEYGVSTYRLRKLLLQYRVQDAPVQQALSELYFNNLFELSGGNMETALYYWLRSLELHEQGHISVSPCKKVDSGFIKKLDTMNMFSLAEVLAHGGLTTKEHGDIFNVDQLRSRLILDYLRQIRLLKGQNKDKHGQPQFYSINPLFYQPIYTALSASHIIY